jgi:serine/threonine-protein kinase HipA
MTMPSGIDAAEVTVDIDGNEVVAGTLRVIRRRTQSVGFEYDESYLADPRAYALDPSLPLNSGFASPPGDKELFNFLSDVVPDRWGQNLMRRQEREQAVAAGTTPRSLSAVDFLFGVHDELRQGAVRLRNQDNGRHYTEGEGGVPRMISLPRLLSASDAYNDNDNEGTDTDLSVLFAAGSSLGGTRPKAALVDEEGKLVLAKFSRPGDGWDIAAFERVQHILAVRAGINTTRSRLVRVGGRSVLLVERFDREEGRRIGFMSALTALEGSDMVTRSYLELADAVERESGNPADDLEQLFRRLVFSILTSNTDDHLRNHGLLRRGRGWDLSPAYDLNPNPEQTAHLQMAVDLDNTSADIDLALSTAGYYRLSSKRAKEIVSEIELATRDWREAAAKEGIGPRDIERMSEAFETPQRDVARHLVDTVPQT